MMFPIHKCLMYVSMTKMQWSSPLQNLLTLSNPTQSQASPVLQYVQYQAIPVPLYVHRQGSTPASSSLTPAPTWKTYCTTSGNMVEKVAKSCRKRSNSKKNEPTLLTNTSVLKWLNGAKKSGMGDVNFTPAKDSAEVFDKVSDAVSNILNSTKHHGAQSKPVL